MPSLPTTTVTGWASRRRQTLWSELATLTPGTTNAAALQREIVINEIMYHPISDSNEDEYVELYNRGTNRVDLAGWRP